MRPTVLFCLMMVTSSMIYAQPPYWGTIFIDPDILTSSDPSAIQSTTYTGQGMVTMYDRRVPGWVNVNAYLFDVVWNDGLTSVAQINPEFDNVGDATIEAEKYASLIGQLPYCLRVDVNEIWIHKGVELFGGGNNSILIHTGQSINYENEGIIEETLIHEASHTSLDASHGASSGWINAQNLDNEFISTYAQDNPTSEDIAESFLNWLAVRYREEMISIEDYTNITQTIPNRLEYFDSIDCDLSPFEENPTNTNTQDASRFTIFPNPVMSIIYIEGKDIDNSDIKIYNLLGQDLTHFTLIQESQIDVSKLPRGHYILKVKTSAHKMYKQ